MENRVFSNMNITINAKRVCREVIENMEVQWILNKHEKELVEQTVETTIWELFERKEEDLKEILKSYTDKSDFKYEFKK